MSRVQTQKLEHGAVLNTKMTIHYVQMKNGASPVETCEIFESVTIVFNDIPMFSDICAQCDGNHQSSFFTLILKMKPPL